MKGIQKIKWSGKGKIDPKKSIPNATLCVLGDGDVTFAIDKWYSGTSEQDKKKPIVWILQDSNRKEIKRTTKNSNEEFILNIPNELCGPYTYYLEASLSGIIDLKNNTGLYVFGTCTQKIVSSKWCASNDGTDVRKEQFKYGHLVYLGLETEGLNGEKNLSVEVYKKVEGFTLTGGRNGTSDDKLIHTYTSVDIIDGEVNLKIGNTANWFVYAKKDEEQFYIKVKNGSGVYISDGKDTIHARFLRLKKEQITKAVEPPTNNTPLKVGNATTNFLRYDKCRYDLISLKKQKGNVVEVFNSEKIKGQSKKSIEIEIVAGKKSTYLLDFDFKTNWCPVDHKNKEIIVYDIPKNYKLVIDKSSKAKHITEEKKNELIKIESKTLNSSGMIKTSQNEDIPIEKGLIKVKQNQIEFDTFYNYEIPKDGNSIWMFAKTLQYFWLPNLDLGKNKISRIKANVKTCAFKQDINIAIYPDIKWSLIFGFNIKKDQLTTLIPSWNKEKTVSSFEWKDDKFKKIDKETQDKINNKMLDVYKTNQGGSIPVESPKPSNTKGKISTLVEIMKKVNISLKAQIYEDRNIELTKDFAEKSQGLKFYKDIYEKLRWAVDILDGKLDNPKNKPQADAHINEYLKENELNLRVKHLTEALTRKPQEVEIVYPKFSLSGSWQYETIDAKKHIELAGRSGLAYNIVFAAKPLIGIEIKWHILDLLCRRHPVAYAVLAAVKTLLAAIGDNPDGIKLDMWVKGEINADVKFEGNFLYSDKKIGIKPEAHITMGIDVSIKIIGKIAKGKYEAVAEAGIGGKGEVGLGINGTLGVDNVGWFLQSNLIFDGIKLSFEAVVSARIVMKTFSKDNGKVESSDVFKKESKFEGEITLFARTFKSEPFHFKNFT